MKNPHYYLNTTHVFEMSNLSHSLVPAYLISSTTFKLIIYPTKTEGKRVKNQPATQTTVTSATTTETSLQRKPGKK